MEIIIHIFYLAIIAALTISEAISKRLISQQRELIDAQDETIKKHNQIQKLRVERDLAMDNIVKNALKMTPRISMQGFQYPVVADQAYVMPQNKHEWFYQIQKCEKDGCLNQSQFEELSRLIDAGDLQKVSDTYIKFHDKNL